MTVIEEVSKNKVQLGTDLGAASVYTIQHKRVA
jgi:hypothetical protein